MITKPVVNRVQYTEAEAAAQLGITVDEFRALICQHIGVDDADVTNVPMTTFQSSDLLLLRLLAKSSSSPLV